MKFIWEKWPEFFKTTYFFSIQYFESVKAEETTGAEASNEEPKLDQEKTEL